MAMMTIRDGTSAPCAARRLSGINLQRSFGKKKTVMSKIARKQGRKRALKEEYEKALASLESREEDIIFGHKHRKVKNLVKKKEN
mgnify:CR=1 FL=1